MNDCGALWRMITISNPCESGRNDGFDDRQVFCSNCHFVRFS
jgi:hypothetical protein